jgi:hypothetical protein
MLTGTSNGLANPEGPICSICHKPVCLESAKTDEGGKAVHENCYWEKVNSSFLSTTIPQKAN